MASYVAECISEAETAEGEDARAARDRCADVVISLWRYRSVVPFTDVPPDSASAILRAIERLDPENAAYRYRRLYGAKPRSSQRTPVETVLELAERIDSDARRTVRALLREAFQLMELELEEWKDAIVAEPDALVDILDEVFQLISVDNTPESVGGQIPQERVNVIRYSADLINTLHEVGSTLKLLPDVPDSQSGE